MDFKCNNCGRLYFNRWNLRQHVKENHSLPGIIVGNLTIWKNINVPSPGHSHHITVTTPTDATAPPPPSHTSEGEVFDIKMDCRYA